MRDTLLNELAQKIVDSNPRAKAMEESLKAFRDRQSEGKTYPEDGFAGMRYAAAILERYTKISEDAQDDGKKATDVMLEMVDGLDYADLLEQVTALEFLIGAARRIHMALHLAADERAIIHLRAEGLLNG